MKPFRVYNDVAYVIAEWTLFGLRIRTADMLTVLASLLLPTILTTLIQAPIHIPWLKITVIIVGSIATLVSAMITIFRTIAIARLKTRLPTRQQRALLEDVARNPTVTNYSHLIPN